MKIFKNCISYAANVALSHFVLNLHLLIPLDPYFLFSVIWSGSRHSLNHWCCWVGLKLTFVIKISCSVIKTFNISYTQLLVLNVMFTIAKSRLTENCQQKQWKWHSNCYIPCAVCEKSVAINHEAVYCRICNRWIHIRCNNIWKKILKIQLHGFVNLVSKRKTPVLK